MIEIFNDSHFKFSEWSYDGTVIRMNHIKTGCGAYSEHYDLIVIMAYETQGQLDLKVYNKDGSLVCGILPSSENILYQYMSKHPESKSGIVVVGAYENDVNGFSQWHFEVDLENFCVGKRISPAY